MLTKPFAGKDNKAEEMAEAKAVRAGKVSPKAYVKREKSEGDTKSSSSLMATGKALASGRMSASQYASTAKMADGGYVCKDLPMMAGNAPSTRGGQRSPQDYKK